MQVDILGDPEADALAAVGGGAQDDLGGDCPVSQDQAVVIESGLIELFAVGDSRADHRA